MGGRFAGMETTNKLAPDWEKIEADYRAGIKTLRQCAASGSASLIRICARSLKGRSSYDSQTD